MNVYEWIFHIYLCIILLFFFFCNLTLYHETHTLSFHTFRKYDIMALDALFMQSTVIYLGSPFIGRLSYFGLWTVINSVVISDVVHKSLCGFVILCSGMTQLKDMDVETLDKLPHCPLDGTCWCKAQIWLCGTLWLGPWINAGEVPAGTQALRDPLIRLRGTVCLDPGPCSCPRRDPPSQPPCTGPAMLPESLPPGIVLSGHSSHQNDSFLHSSGLSAPSLWHLFRCIVNSLVFPWGQGPSLAHLSVHLSCSCFPAENSVSGIVGFK